MTSTAHSATRPRRFRGLSERALRVGSVPVASTARSRLLGLAWLDRRDAPIGLLIPGCRSVHTFGMRFPIDLVFLDRNLGEVARRLAIPPRRIVFQRDAASVLEVPA